MQEDNLITCESSGQTLLHAVNIGERLVSSDNPCELMNEYPGVFSTSHVREESVFHILNANFIPYPQSMFPNFYTIGPHDSLLLEEKNVHYIHEDHLIQNLSRQDQKPDTSHLLGLLTASSERLLTNSKDPVLMMSSGKDSVSLALALSRTHVKERLRSITFVNGNATDEDDVAKKVCRKLQLEHISIQIDVEDNNLCNQLENSTKDSAYPSTDQATIPYVSCISQMGDMDYIIDGTGNDSYFGMVPPDWLLWKDRLYPNGLPLGSVIVPIISRRNRYARLFLSRPESHFGNILLSYPELESMLPSARIEGYRHYWERVGNQKSHLSSIDFCVNVRLHVQDRQQVMRKVRSVGEAFNLTPVFPWCEDELTSYCFNLPESARYNFETKANKVLVRQMLKEYLEYDAAKIGKKVFQFQGDTFLNRHKKWVLNEILECNFWKNLGTRKEVERVLNRLYLEMDQGLRAKNGIIGLLQFCGWYNHSKYIARK